MTVKRFSLLILIFLLLMPPVASAHGGHLSPVQTFTQIIGPYAIGVTIEIPSAVPSPIYLIVQPEQTNDQLAIQLQAVPRGFPTAGAQSALVNTFSGTRIYYAELKADQLGDWDLVLQVKGPQGSGIARIPFTITAATIPVETIPLTISLSGLLLLLITSLSLGGIAKRRQRAFPKIVDQIIGQAIFACLIVAGIMGIQLYFNQQAQASALLTTPGGAPHVNVALQTDPAQPTAGQPFTLTLNLTDGSTGLPVDDLIPHHDALVHLVLIDDSGASFNHVHPASTKPGLYSLPLTLDRAGHYGVYIEVERNNSGTQIIQRSLTITGPPAPEVASAPGLGTRTIGDLTIDASMANPPKAGQQSILTLRISQNGHPVTDIEPWLGMAGHLLARSSDGNIFGHIHAAGVMLSNTTNAAVITPPSYGPDIQFVYTFPQAGRYQLWAQFQRAGVIYTVPISLDVAAQS